MQRIIVYYVCTLEMWIFLNIIIIIMCVCDLINQEFNVLSILITQQYMSALPFVCMATLLLCGTAVNLKLGGGGGGGGLWANTSIIKLLL